MAEDTTVMQARIDGLNKTVEHLATEARQLRIERDHARDVGAFLASEADELDTLGTDYACWCHWEEIQDLTPCEHDPAKAAMYVGMPTLDELLAGYAAIQDKLDEARWGKYLDLPEEEPRG